MGSKEFERLKEALQRPPTPEAMREAAEKFSDYLKARPTRGGRHTPYLVSLGRRTGYPNQIRLERVGEELKRNPALYRLLAKVVAKGKR